jgi:hypothetical protein
MGNVGRRRHTTAHPAPLRCSWVVVGVGLGCGLRCGVEAVSEADRPRARTRRAPVDRTRGIGRLLLPAVACLASAVPAQAHFVAGCKGARCERHVARPYRGWLHRVAQCESGDRPWAVSLDGRYRGLYQFDYGTWRSVGGWGDPARAGRVEQSYRAVVLLHGRGTSPWPICGAR